MAPDDERRSIPIEEGYTEGITEEVKEIGERTESTPSEPDQAGGSEPSNYPSHVFNENIPKWVRYGVVLFFLGTLAFLTASDVGSGVSADNVLFDENGLEDTRNTLLSVSIISSVGELWKTGSYPLAIFIAITSVMWPYLKLILSLAAWVLPIRNPRRREIFLECLDALDKWSFVDIFVLITVMVAFRDTIPAPLGLSLEVVLVPKWGFYGFVAANMLSLVGTQIILYYHRQIVYPPPTEESKTELEPLYQKTKTSPLLLILSLVVPMALHIAGSIILMFQVTKTSGNTTVIDEYSSLILGTDLPGASLEPNEFGIRWIQAMYFLLAFVLPIWNIILLGALYFVPWKNPRIVFFLSEITYSWAAVEVLVISTLFAVLQIPKFGNGLIDGGCEACFSVDSALFPRFAVLCVSSTLYVIVNLWLFLRAHRVIYPHNS